MARDVEVEFEDSEAYRRLVVHKLKADSQVPLRRADERAADFMDGIAAASSEFR